MISFKTKINNDWYNFTTVYAPPDDDNPYLFLKAKGEHDSMDSDLGMICGDFNTTLDLKEERFGYKTYCHKNADIQLTTGLKLMR